MRPRRRPGRLTREGKAFVFVTIGVGVASVNTGNNLLYLMLGLMLSLLLLSMVLSEVALRSLRLNRRLPRHAFAGGPCLVEVVLGNGKRLVPSYSLEVEDVAVGGDVEERCYYLKVSPESDELVAYQRTPKSRGPLKFTGFRVRTRYPFGLVEKEHHYEGLDELLVFPKLVPAPFDPRRSERLGRDHPTGKVGMGTEIGGIREYFFTDEARTIHWRRTAALGRLVVRETERDASKKLILAVDNLRPPGAEAEWDESFEMAISKAASVAAQALSRGSAVQIRAHGSESPEVSPRGIVEPIWRYLALLQPVDEGAAEPVSDGPS